MAFAPPVSRDNFYYNGDLYVEVGNFNRHKRATVNEITAILRPDLRESTKVSSDAIKDQVGHWYEAQLIHYGLPPSKDKARAKMRLLEALNSSKLSVPSNIAKMEAGMKTEYAAADKKAKAQYKASQAPAKKSEPPTPSRKRKQSDTSGNINNIQVSINLGSDFAGLSRSVNASPSQSPAKKSKAATSKPPSKKADITGPPTPIKKTTLLGSEASSLQSRRPIQTARSQKLHEAWLKDPTLGPGPVNPASFRYSMTPSSRFNVEEGDLPYASDTHGEATKGSSPALQQSFTKKATDDKQKGKLKSKPPVKKEPSVKKEIKPKKEGQVKTEPSVKPSSKVKREPELSSSRKPNVPSLGLINGIYDLSCPTIEDNWPCRDPTLTLSLDGTTVWGAYDLDMFSGIVYLPSRPWQSSNEPLSFSWRGRENGEGQMEFGDHCQGEISFLGSGKIEGWISVYGRCEFTGFRRHEAGTAVRTARSMREEWEEYNEDAYERERVGRWH